MKKLSGFSLMEMMVVLLITAIVAAVTAPMISKKMVSSAGGDSPWLWAGLNHSIVYNVEGNILKTVNIGGIMREKDPISGNDLNSRLYLEISTFVPHITFKSNSQSYNSGGLLHLMIDNSSIVLSNLIPSMNSCGASVVLGVNAKATNHGAVAIGTGSDTSDTTKQVIAGFKAIAIGTESQASANDTIAIGDHTRATAEKGIAIGYKAASGYANSVAIGSEAQTDATNQIVLGDANTTVKIPGTLDIQNLTVSGNKLKIDKAAVSYSQTTENVLIVPTTSDRRLKNVGEAFKGGLADVKKLEVFNYTYKKDKNKTPMVGVIAQDLQKVFPNAVFKGDDGFYRIRMEDMFYSMINAIKELDLKINGQDKKIEELQKQNSELQKKLDKLEKRIEKLEGVVNKKDKGKGVN